MACDPAIKFCKDCTHHRISPQVKLSGVPDSLNRPQDFYPPTHMCVAPRAIVDVVTGESVPQFCSVMRVTAAGINCGPSARWFVRKPEGP